MSSNRFMQAKQIFDHAVATKQSEGTISKAMIELRELENELVYKLGYFETIDVCSKLPPPTPDYWTCVNESGWGMSFITFKCTKCGYSFGSRHCMIDSGSPLYDMILGLAVSRQKSHEHLFCNSFCTYG